MLEEVHIRFGDEHKLTVAVDSAAGQGTVDSATGQGTVDSDSATGQGAEDSATGQGAEVAVANSAGSSNNKDNRSFHSFRSLKLGVCLFLMCSGALAVHVDFPRHGAARGQGFVTVVVVGSLELLSISCLRFARPWSKALYAL